MSKMQPFIQKMKIEELSNHITEELFNEWQETEKAKAIIKEIKHTNLGTINIKREIIIAQTDENELIIIDGKKRFAALKKLYEENVISNDEINENFIWIIYNIEKKDIPMFEWRMKNLNSFIKGYEKSDLVAQYVRNQYKSKGSMNKYEIIAQAGKMFQLKERTVYNLLEVSKVPDFIRIKTSPQKALKIKKILETKGLNFDNHEAINKYKDYDFITLKKILEYESIEEDKFIKQISKSNIEFKYFSKKEFSNIEKEIIKEKLLEFHFFISNLKNPHLIDEEPELYFLRELAEDMIKEKGYFIKSDFCNTVDEDELKKMGYYKEKIRIENSNELLEVWKNNSKTESLHDTKFKEYLNMNLKKSEIFCALSELKFSNYFPLNYEIYDYNILGMLGLKKWNFFQCINLKNKEYEFLRIGLKEKRKKAIIPDAYYFNKNEEIHYFWEYEYSFKDYGIDANARQFLEYFKNKIYNYVLLYVYLVYERIYNQYSNKKLENIKTSWYTQKFRLNIVYNSNFYSYSNYSQIKNKHLEIMNSFKEKYRNLIPILKNIKVEINYF